MVKIRKENFYNHKNGYGLGTDFTIVAHTVDGKVVDFNIGYQANSTPSVMTLLAKDLEKFAATITKNED
jgi:hypothetical protein